MLPRKDSSISQRIKASRKDEQRVAKTLGGKRLPASGAMVAKLDGKTPRADLVADGFHIEQKSTEKEQISFKREWVEKVTLGAQAQAHWPAISLTFQKDDVHWIGIPETVAKQLFLSVYSFVWSSGRSHVTPRQSYTFKASYFKALQKTDAIHCWLLFTHPSEIQWMFFPLASFQRLLEARREL